MKIAIPFSDRFANAMIQERKTATTRYRRYGHAGDYFEAFGCLFCIDEVKLVYLWRVARLSFHLEGFDSEQEFIDCWISLHPDPGYRPNDRVYYHRFFRET